MVDHVTRKQAEAGLSNGPAVEAAPNGLSLLRRVQRDWDPELGQQTINILASEAEEADIPSTVRASRLGNLAAAHYVRFEHERTLTAINDAIHARQRSVDATDRNDPALATRLSALAGSRRSRYEMTGDRRDIDSAINLGHEALRLTNDPNRTAGIRTGLANSLRVRYERLGHPADLDASISQDRAAVDQAKPGSATRGSRLTNLSISLRDRYLLHGNDADLEEAVDTSREALSYPSDNNTQRARRLTNYALALRSSHVRDSVGGGLAGPDTVGLADDLNDINDAVAALTEAVHLSDDAATGFRMSKLSAALLTRHEATNDSTDANDAVTWARRAVAHADLTDRSTDSWTNDLVYALLRAAATQQKVSLAQEAIQQGHRLLGRLNQGNVNRALYMINVGLAHRARYELTGDKSDADAAMSIWQSAAETSSSTVRERYNAAVHWAQFSAWIHPGSDLAFDGYTAAVSFIPVLAWRGIPPLSRERFLRDVTGLGSRAVATALAANRPELAVSYAENSRAVLWSQLLDLRTDPIRLRAEHSHLAKRLDHVRALLDGPEPATLR